MDSVYRQRNRNMENRQQFLCNACVHKECWKYAYTVMGITFLVLIAVLTVMHIRSDTKTVEQLQTTGVVNELDEMVYNLYRIISGGNVDKKIPLDKSNGLVAQIDRTKFYTNVMKQNLHRLLLADGTGIADFALESAGAQIVSIGKTKLITDSTSNFIHKSMNYFGFDNTMFVSNHPVNVIQPSLQPGHCFAFRGTGEIVIKLARSTYINAVSIDHILPEMSPDGSIRNAPKTFAVYGVRPDWASVHLGSFVYDIEHQFPIQTFTVDKSNVDQFQFVKFIFFTNHGHPDHTCVYRVRVHGTVESL